MKKIDPNQRAHCGPFDSRKELERLRHARYRAKNRKKLRAVAKRWRKRHPGSDERKARRFRRQRKHAIIVAYGGRCANPHCLDPFDLTVLTIDHAAGVGAGAAERQALAHFDIYKNLYHELYKKPVRSDLRVLCANCNARARYFGPDIESWPRFDQRCDEQFTENDAYRWQQTLKRVDAVWRRHGFTPRRSS